jgi:hypothetical protein
MEQTSQEKGKSAELLVFSELIKRGADLFIPVIDKGIDAVILKSNGTYQEIQIKATQEDDQSGYFNVYDINEHDEKKFYIICVDMNEKNSVVKDRPNIWILPAKDFKEYMVSGYRLPIYECSRKHGNKLRQDMLEKYRDAWELLTESQLSGTG